MAARRQVSIFINGKEVANNVKSITAEKRKLNRELNHMTIGSKEYIETAAKIKQINGTLKEHRDGLRNVESTWSKVRKGAINFAAVAGIGFTADVVVSYGKELFRLGTEMEVLGKKAATVFGQALPQVTEAAEQNANAMGLTTSQYTDAATAIGDLLIPMQFTREEAASISTELVDLSGALSEWTGGQKTAQEVTDILGKAILGEREQLKTLGISIQEADVKARLAEKGLSNLTGEMLQQAKAAATLELITEKSADAQTAFANNSDLSIRKQAELNAQLTDIKETIAQALIPVFSRLLDAVAPVVDVAGGLIKSLLSGEEASGRFAGAINFLSKGISNAAKFFRLLFSIVGKVGNFFLDKFGGAIEFVGVKFLELQNFIIKGLNALQDFIGVDVGKFELFDIEAFKDGLKKAKEEREKSGIDDPIDISPAGQAISDDREKSLQDASIAEKRRKEQEKEAEREKKAAIKRLERLEEITKSFAEKAQLARLSENDRKIAELEAQFDKEIAVAKELETRKIEGATEQRLALERIKEEQVSALRQELAQKEIEEAAELERLKSEAETQRFFEEQDKKREAKLLIAEELRTEREQEIIDLQFHFFELLSLAEEYGISTVEIEKKYQKEKEALDKKFQADDKKRLIQSQKERAQLLAQSFEAIGTTIGTVLQVVGEESTKFAGLAQFLAVAQIATNSAVAIAKGVAAASGVGFPGNLAAIATTVATVLSNIGLARRELASAPKVRQRKRGRWLNARGQDDGVNYRVQYIGSANTGLLPDHPVLLDSVAGGPVIASEQGSEYFVSHTSLKNPAVLNHVRAIENITRFRQFVDGGSTGELDLGTNADNTNTTAVAPETIALMEAINRLNENLERGIIAMLPDETIISFQKRLNQLVEASGGTLV